jgi:tetratricopeptide (TPR) repeat protein
MDGLLNQTAHDAKSTQAQSHDAIDFAASIQFNQGTELLRRRQFLDAEDCLREAIRFRPDHADAFNNLGTAVWHQGRLSEAEDHYRRALGLNPNDFAILNNLGNVLWDQRRLDDASDCYRRALQLRPDSPETQMNLSVLLSDQGQYEEAIARLQESLRLRPDSHEALDNLGSTLARQGKWDEALSLYEHALRLNPDYPEAHRNRSFAWLARGDFERGWPEYEWRLKCRKHRGMTFGRPRWNGENLAGKTILLHAEQGLGDSLQFIRFAPLVKRRGRPRILFYSPPPLATLIESCPGIDRVLTSGSDVPEFDVHASLMSLPALLGTTLATLPRNVPYLYADRQAIEKWRPIVAKAFLGDTDRPPPRLKVGIAWQGNPLNRVDHWRSYPLAQLAPLADLPGVRLMSLQRGHGTDQLQELTGRISVAELNGGNQSPDDDRDFLDTAAVMSQLDLVVTPETAVAHLAGSLGVPVWVALSHVGDWRWQLDQNASPWYPTLRLFRQPTPGDWNDVFSQMAHALKKQLGDRP